jgi:hypothetical protein
VAINNLMEDAATVEISRMQIWHWVHQRASTADGTAVTAELVRELAAEEAERCDRGAADATLRTRVVAARDVFETEALADDCPQFFTSYAYDPTWWRLPNLLDRVRAQLAAHRGRAAGASSSGWPRPDRARPPDPDGRNLRLATTISVRQHRTGDLRPTFRGRELVAGPADGDDPRSARLAGTAGSRLTGLGRPTTR